MKKILTVLAIAALVAFAAPAFAANPFMDVPAGHWAYDAVAQLAADGIVSGYPDGAFKGAQPATRYEVASMVARALAKVDMDKASKQDLEMLKKLVMEFKDELDALGVKVDGLDKRVAVLEKNLGGWKLTGEFRFDANFASDADNAANTYLGEKVDRNFNVSRVRLHLYKFIDENTTFYGRINGADTLAWQRAYVDMKLPYDINFRVGRFNLNWEGDEGLVQADENDPWLGDLNVEGFQFAKNFGGLKAVAIVARNFDDDTIGNGTFTGKTDVESDYMLYALKLKYDFNEKFRLGGMAYWLNGDTNAWDAAKNDRKDSPENINTYSIFAGYDITPNVTLQGIYDWQKIDGLDDTVYEDSPKAWRVQLNLKQELLKFTSIWAEYGQSDNTFLDRNTYSQDGGTGAYDWTGKGYYMANRPFGDGTSKFLLIRLDQQWNEKWSTFERYFHADFDNDYADDTQAWTLGVRYQYTPAVNFELAYDQIDHGDDNLTGKEINGKESLFRFRTYVAF